MTMHYKQKRSNRLWAREGWNDFCDIRSECADTRHRQSHPSLVLKLRWLNISPSSEEKQVLSKPTQYNPLINRIIPWQSSSTLAAAASQLVESGQSLTNEAITANTVQVATG
jgi:hypothetical protein